MKRSERRLLAVFRLALRERDWPLAALLAGSLSHDADLRPHLDAEARVAGLGPSGRPVSVGALRTLARAMRELGLAFLAV